MCARCGKLPEHTHKSGKNKGKGRSWCSPCLNKANYETKKNNPEKYLRQRRNAHLKKKYGITFEDYERMLEDQGGVCAACKSAAVGYGNGRHAVDHCHSTNKVRGILCGHCNIALGNVKDSIEILEGLIAYLKGQPVG